MKRFVFLLFSYFIFFGICKSQFTIDDIIKSSLFDNQTSNSLITKAIEPNLSIIRQQYRLEKDGSFYGRKNQSFYGESYTLAIKVAGGKYLQKEVLFPWQNDKEYQRINKTGKYIPVLFWSKERNLNDSVYEPVELELNTKYVESVTNDSSLFLHTDAISDFGLYIDKSPGKKEGYMIWAYSSTNLKDSLMSVSLKQETLTLNTIDSLKVKMNPENSEKILGGLYVVPSFKSAGQIQLKISGIAAKNDETDWILHLFAPLIQKNTEIEKQPEEEEIVDDSEPTKI